jgi:sialate O-acetylesterase
MVQSESKAIETVWREVARALLSITLLSANANCYGDITLASIFGDRMVVQREADVNVWGSADAGERVTVTGSWGEHAETVADEKGKWQARLATPPAGGPHTITVDGKNSIELKDVLSGDVWICSGQSNMEWPVMHSAQGDLEIISAHYPEIRHFRIGDQGAHAPKDDIRSVSWITWKVCNKANVGSFSAVGYYFARRIHQATGVPIGLINNSWGGSTAEAWVPRRVLESDPIHKPCLAKWDTFDREYTEQVHAEKIVEWEASVNAWKAGGRKGKQPHRPMDRRYGQHRPANLFNARIHPILPLRIRGVIWYQGESNTSNPESYDHLFPALIRCWRDQWQQGEFPFYWVQLADCKAEVSEPGDANWARLREAQTKTQDILPNTGEAVIIDAGEAQDWHPRNKQVVGDRLARIALANDYGLDVAWRSPRFDNMTVQNNTALITFRHVGAGGLCSFDVGEVRGFAIAGSDRKFTWAKAEIVGHNQVKVWSDLVKQPASVRYAWADNPVCNLQDRNGLQVTPFRTDDWEQKK